MLLLWDVSGALAAQSPFPAHLNPMLQLDRWLFVGHDPVVLVQHGLEGSNNRGPLDILTVFTYNMHLPEPFLAGYFLWRLDRPVYFQFAAASSLLLVLGFVTFILFPAIPPWAASQWYHRLPGVVNLYGPIVANHPFPFHPTTLAYLFNLQSDQIAAVPSEHAAFPMLEFLAFRCVLPRGSRFFLLWLAVVLFSVVYLGEHWVADVLAGWLYAVVLFAVIRFLARAHSRLHRAPASSIATS